MPIISTPSRRDFFCLLCLIHYGQFFLWSSFTYWCMNLKGPSSVIDIPLKTSYHTNQPSVSTIFLQNSRMHSLPKTTSIRLLLPLHPSSVHVFDPISFDKVAELVALIKLSTHHVMYTLYTKNIAKDMQQKRFEISAVYFAGHFFAIGHSVLSVKNEQINHSESRIFKRFMYHKYRRVTLLWCHDGNKRKRERNHDPYSSPYSRSDSTHLPTLPLVGYF